LSLLGRESASACQPFAAFSQSVAEWSTSPLVIQAIAANS
jgi:hypothetical protein